MPARRDYTPEELAARLERDRELARIRQANWRARHRVTVTGNEGSRNGHAVTVTPPPPPAPPVPTVSAGSYGTRGRGNAKVSAVVDALRERGLPDALTGRDCKAIKESRVEPERIAEAFGAAFRGQWGNGWLRDNLAMWAVLERFAAYEASLGGPKRRNPGPERLPVLAAPLERIAPDEVSRELARRSAVPLADKLAQIRGGKR
jgi:hypothetical protein